MASLHSQTTIILFLFSAYQPSESCGIAVFWSQHSYEGSLRNTFATRNYKYVTLAFLTTFGSGQIPVLDLAGHCDPSSGACSRLRDEIRFCQSLGIQVLLSLGGAIGRYNLSSPEKAREVANYLWTAFLARNSSGPLGNATMDGIDFDIEFPRSTHYWEELARALAQFSRPQKKIYLSAAPQCPYPDRDLDAANRTGLVDYVWFQFYSNPECDYRSGVEGIIRSWNEWSSALWWLSSGTELFMGLPASPQAHNGYIPPDDLRNYILPEIIKKSRDYEGVMLWSRYYDMNSGYSSLILSAVCDANLTVSSEGLYSN